MRRRLAVLGILTLLMLSVVTLSVVTMPATAVAAGPATLSAFRAQPETGKYYVVGPPINGQREYLFAIAAKTLGDGGRSREIFTLNEGRLQPDGGRMTDPTTVEPGWILVLPADATGPGVLTGPLPPSNTASETPQSAETPATPPAASADAESPPVAAPGAPEPPNSRNLPDLSALWSPTGLRVALVALAVLLLLWAQAALWSRHRHPRAAPATARTSAPARPAAAPPAPQPAPARPAATPPAPRPTAGTAHVTTTPAPPAVKQPPACPAGRPAAPAVERPVVTTRPRSPAMLARPSPPAPPATGSPIPMPDLRLTDLLPASAPSPFATLVTDLTCGPDLAKVRLIGARPTRWGSGHGWLADEQPPPPSNAPVVLGDLDGRRLWIDLAVVPDALTISGDPAACRRQGQALVNQLSGDTEVVVAGTALGGTAPAVGRRIESVSELAADRSTANLRVVVCAGADAAALWGLLHPLPQNRSRTVPVILGPAPAARWALRLGRPAARTAPGR